MEPDDVRRMFEYLIETRAKFVETFRSIDWEEVSRDRGASWGSMREIFVHMLDVEEGWWQIALTGGDVAAAPDRKGEDYGSLDRLAELNAQVSALTRSRLEGLTENLLGGAVAFQDRRGSWKRAFAQIVVHAFIDETAHVGELVCLLWQINVPPPYVDWLDFQVA